ILDRPAAAADNDDVNASYSRDRSQCARDVEGGALALNSCRTNHDLCVGGAPAQHLDDVANRRAVERGAARDLLRQVRQRALSRRVEESLDLQALLELIEGELESPESLRLQMLADDLVFALGFVDRDLAACHDAQAVGRLELQIAQ